MKLILHVGMHKTGTSSIQDTLFACSKTRNDIAYLPWKTSNHSGWFIQQFQDEDKVADYHGFRAQGLTKDALLTRREESFRIVDEYLTKRNPQTLFVSAEDISATGFASALRRFKIYTDSLGAEVEVIGYIRPPISYVQSAFQQLLKGGAKPDFNFDWQMPRYRTRFEKLYDTFGDENIHLKKFDSALLHKGDAVADFARTVGLSLEESEIVRSNESLSLEATALLYVQRHFGDGFVRGFPLAQRNNQAFIATLSRIGNGRLMFSRALFEPLLEAHRDDIEWIESRLGQSLDEKDKPGERTIGSEQDLVEVAFQVREELAATITSYLNSDRGRTTEGMAAAIDLVRKTCI